MNKTVQTVFLLLLLAGLAASVVGGETAPKGHLVVVGGGERPGYLMQEIVRLGGGADGRFVVLPMASAEPADVGAYQAEQLRSSGAGVAEVLIASREEADDPQTLARLDGVTGVFFSGGDQRRLADALEGTALLERIRTLYRGGAVVAGTSAGAAVMSPVMITGDEHGLPEDAGADEKFDDVRAETVVTRPGFGLLPGTVVDQHFLARKRHNRLIAVVLERPELLGIGLDESTAIVVSHQVGGPRFRVLGEAQAVVYDASRASPTTTDEDGHLAATGLRLHLLRSGQGFDLETREPLP